MGYSHGSNYLRDRHDRYGGTPYRHRDYAIPTRHYGGKADLSGYLKQIGLFSGYSVNFDFYKAADKKMNDGFVLHYGNSSAEFRGYASRRLESRLY